MLTGMTATFRRSATLLITTIQKLFSEDLTKENSFLRQENKIEPPATAQFSPGIPLATPRRPWPDASMPASQAAIAVLELGKILDKPCEPAMRAAAEQRALDALSRSFQSHGNAFFWGG